FRGSPPIPDLWRRPRSPSRNLTAPTSERAASVWACRQRIDEAWACGLAGGSMASSISCEFASEHPGCCGAQDTFYVGNLKGVGRVYQRTFIDTYTKVAFAKLYDSKTPITAADLLNDRVLPFRRA